MSTWRKRFSRKSRKQNENNETLLINSVKYRKKLQTAMVQINRTKKSVQQNLDSADSPIHIARLLNDIGQLSDIKSLQEISSLIDSLAMRHQLSSRIFNEYGMNSLQQSLENLNSNLANDFDRTRSVYEEAETNHCSDHMKKQLFHKVQTEWSKHQKLAIKEFKHGLSSYCDIGLYNLKIQIAILEKLQHFIDQLPSDGSDTSTGLPNFSASSLQTRKDIDTMLRIMLDTAPNDPTLLPNAKRPKFLSNQLTLSNSLYSAEVSEAAARSHGQSLRQRNTQHCPIVPGSSARACAQHQSTIVTPRTPHADRLSETPNLDSLPSYTDLFVVPSSCKESRTQRRSSRFDNNH